MMHPEEESPSVTDPENIRGPPDNTVYLYKMQNSKTQSLGALEGMEALPVL